MANNQQVRVDLQFKGDISDVEKKLQQLQNTLSGITSGKAIKDMAFTSDINKAVGDATKLQAILKNTTMANGNLDLTKFRSELQKSGMTVKELGNSLLSLGPQGSQAFSQLTQSIMSAEVPLKRTSTLLSNFATTLKNTAKWQISSSILHGFMSSISSAYGYAQDLNESLNNIRIVSKQNTEQMAEFAQEANKAAKELSVSTTAYTDAALIFYQQGLEGDAVTERTDVVAKMSNVTKDSVDEVSSYMTAIWNNFDDGSQSLEHYADVITGLGAATASSSAEIAAGLEKFAAVADTVGLSYDYATSALATVVAQTRQSADTVGTAFKTLFARIEGLQLGETLEDGVDLNKYSKALATIGVNVLDANGKLKEMDAILDEMGSKWDQIGKEQQVAVAQTVAGTRQYNQLVALMDNWDKVQENLQVARSSDGELQKQADIYAESWEAAQKRVRAAWESIYSSLFDDKFFIKLTNGLGSFVEGIDKVVKSLGGLKGILPLLSVGLLNLFNKDIVNGINNFVYNLQIGTKKAQNELISFKEQMKEVFDGMTSDGSLSSGASIDALKGMASIQAASLERQRQLNELGIEESEIQKLLNQYGIKRIEQLGQEMVLKAQAVELAEKEAQEAEKKLQGSLNANLNQGSFITEEQKQNLLNIPNNTKEDKEKYQNYITQEEVQRVLDLSKAYAQANDLIERFIKISKEQGDAAAIEWINKDIKNLEEFNVLLESSEQEVVDLKAALVEGFQKSGEIENTIEQEQIYNNLLDQTEDLALEAENEYIKLTGRIEENTESTKKEKNAINDLNNAMQANIKLGKEREEHSHSFLNFNSGLRSEQERFKNESNIPQLQPLDYGKTFTDATRAVMNFGTALNSINHLTTTLSSETTTWKEKLLAILTSGSMGLMMMLNSVKSIQGVIASFSTTIQAIQGSLALTNAELNGIVLTDEKLAIINENLNASRIRGLATDKLITEEEAKQIILSTEELTTEGAITAFKEGRIGIAQVLYIWSQLETEEEKERLLAETGITTHELIQLGLKKAKALLANKTRLIMIAILAVVVAITAAYKKWVEHLKQIAENAQKAAEAHQKITDSIKEESDKIKELKKSYDSIYKNYLDHSIAKEELQEESLKLIAQYGEEADALLILGGAYEAFQKKLELAQKQKDKELADSSKIDVENNTKALFSDLTAYRAETGLNPFKEHTRDFKISQPLFNKKEQNDYNSLKDKDLIVQTPSLGFAPGGVGINYEEQLNYNKIIQELQKDKNGEFELYLRNLDLTGVQEFLKYIDQNTEGVNKLKESYQQFKEAALAQGFDEIFDASRIDNNIEKYNATFKEFKNLENIKALDLDESELEEYFDSMASGIEDTANLVGSKDLAKKLINIYDVDEELDKLTNILMKFSDSEKAFILLHPVLASGFENDIEQGIQEFLNKTEGVRKQADEKNKFDQSSKLLQSYAKEGKFSDEEIIQIQDLEIITSGKTPRELANELEELYQKSAAAANKYFAEAKQASADYAKQIEEDYGKESTTLQVTGRMVRANYSDNDYTIARDEEIKAGFEKNENNTDYEDLINEEFGERIKNQADQIEFLTEQYAALLEKKTEQGELSKEEEEAFEKLENAIGNSAGALRKAAKDHNKFNKASEEAIALQENVKEAIIDASLSFEKLKQDLINTSTELDEIQAAYKQLYSAMEEYNENKTLSLDTVQALTKLGPQFVQYLVNENGELELNEAAIRAATEAKYREMEAEQAQILLKQLNIIATAKEVNEEYNAVVAAYASATALENMGMTMDYVIQQAGRISSALPGATEAINGITNAANAFKQLFSAGEKGMNTNFPKFMGVSPKKGSGSKGKSKEEKELKEWADEFDRFYPLQKVIDDLADAISDLAKEQEHMAGGELVGAIRKQNRLLQEQKKAYQDLAKEQKAYQKEMQADLAKYGMSFEVASGNIANYAEATKAMLDQYNAAIEKYNKSAQEDADKKALEAVEKEYEKFKKLVSNYQGILTEIQDTENELDDIYYETIANNLKEFEIMVEVKLDIGEARRMVNDFIKEINQNFKTLRKTTSEWLDVFESALANAKTYTEGDLGTVNVDLDAYNKVKNAIDSGDYGHEGAMFASETEAITKLKELGEQLKDDSMDLYNIWKDAWEDYIDAVDETLNQWEDLMDGFDDINDELDHWERITELVRKAGDQENDYQVYLDIYDKKMQNEEQRQIALNRQIDALEREYKELINSGASELDEDVQKIKEKMEDASKALYDSVEAYLEALNNRYDKQFEYENKKSIEQALGFSIDEMTTQWDRAKKAEEGYYDANQRIYQLDKLRRKYANAINNTDDLKQKQKLAKMQEAELKGLEEKKALSEGDLQIAEKKLAVQQAQIALEEARDNRSQMRLQRDSQGNWSYQFVADEGNIEDKKQALMDAANELYETVKRNEEESIESIRNIYNTWLEERQNLSRESFESDEAYLAALEELDQYYKGLIETRIGTLNGYRQEQNQATSELLLTSYVVNEENYGKMTEAQQKLIDELKERSIEDMADIATATDEDYEAIKKKAEEVNQQSIAWWDELAKICAIDTEQMAKANEDFYNFVKGLLDQYNADVEAARDASRLAIDDVGSAVEDLGNKITDTADRVDDLVARTDQLSVFRERVNAIEDAWNGVKQSVEDALTSLEKYLARLLEVKDMQDKVKREATDAAAGDIGKGVDMGGGTGNGGSGGGGYTADNDYRNNFVAEREVIYQHQGIASQPIPTKIKVTSTSGAIKYYDYNERNMQDFRPYGEKITFASGGYTGSWNDGIQESDNGKLAWLHQKELVLNQSDTKNILDAVDLARTMKSNNSDFINYIIDSLNAGTEQLIHTLEYGIHSIADRVEYTSNIMAQAVDRGSKDRSPLEQNVHIDASFPNVQSSFEIETALNNLVNVASQRIHSDEILTW